MSLEPQPRPPPNESAPPPSGLPLPLEVRVHGRGGQGGVTCAKLLATLYAELGLHVQTFGDYGSERAGAPVRAFTRVDTAPVTNRNKVYHPHHLLVLDAGLLADDVTGGAAPGADVLVNTARPPGELAASVGRFRLATVDATAIARRHGIGTSALVIVNTTIAGAYARVHGLPWDAVEQAYRHLGLESDLLAAREAYQAVVLHEPAASPADVAEPRPAGAPPEVLDIAAHVADLPTPLLTGAWRTQLPRYQSHAAPCNAACPAGNDVVGFVQALHEEGVEAAAALLLRTQPLPSVCGRVCPAPCMNACNRGSYDGSVNIRALERWIGDRAPATLPLPARAAAPRRLAVVGGGPAGLAAAFALATAGHEVELLEGEPRLGGVLRTGIPAYRLPDEALDRDVARILALGVKASCGAFLDGPAVRALADAHDAVILAAGLPRPTLLEAPGAGLPGVREGLRFLHEVKAGAGEPLSGHVVVVGGGNTAVDCARTALRRGAASVTIAYRRGRAEMPAIASEIEEAVEEGVRILTHRQPLRFEGQGRLEGITLAEVELGAPDAGGRRRPVVTDRTSVLRCDAVLLALGQGADPSLVPAGWTIRGGRAFDGEAPVNLWLAGDVATSEGTVTHAVGHGRRVAARVLAALAGDGAAEPAPPPADALVTPAHVRFSHFEVAPPCHERHAHPVERRATFDEVNRGLDGPEEAARCFSCGRCTQCDTCMLYCPEGIIRREGSGYVVDGDYCKGCGMCVAECPRRAMEMVLDAAVR